ncbi:MAG TPA: hypothetical protein VHD39_07035, partial [Acidimicrobiales bacterium]|nr:hypothetical protein [Acidimicrobiales bacterium]
MSDALTVVITRHWRSPNDEAAFAIRAVAGAASRCGPVAVLEPGPVGRLEPDGAFDREAIGPEGALRLPARATRAQAVIVDELTPEIETLLTAPAPPAVWYLSEADTSAAIGRRLRCAPDPAGEDPAID